VDYFDASVAHNISASATVDTVSPSIANIVADPDYEQATISWTTSENTDALVQYGESAFLNRTAFDPNLATAHSLQLDALLPNHTYFYQVVSRDAAGNTTTDDNNGNLYTFHTKVPIVPPWSDNLDSGATNWSVVSSDVSQTEWTLGVPQNGLVSSAHSPPNAWASNWRGDVIDTAETFLVSPAISLVGGNVATLRFWHAYDFTMDPNFDIINEGDLFILTQNGTVQTPLAFYSDDATFGYVQETIDLTPYMGQVVYLVWAHELFTFDSRQQPGWVVDDVSITVSNIPPGTIQISNNLWQAKYILSGPLYQKLKGLSKVITNAPPGQYIVNFADVAYYNTPPSQTNNLVSGATISFTANYTFTDVNTNDIPDAWELDFFGTVSPNRTRFTDTDGDGMSDYAEFIAGTDPTPVPGDLPPNLRISAQRLINGKISISWSSSIGRGYRVHGSSNGLTWAPVSNWIHATAIMTSYILPDPSPGSPYLFRIQVQP
jgi:hypothetical protein